MNNRLKPWWGMAALAIVATALLPFPLVGNSAPDDAAMTALLDDLTSQQATLLGNQAKLDEKVATVAEEVRQARLFVARGGGAKR